MPALTAPAAILEFPRPDLMSSVLPAAPGTLLETGPVVAAFESRGFIWGGRWETLKDWHHFEKPADT